jgi:lipopolysaccharide/colanic/teichoic acid biosynthesis glycosyltransferase
MTNEYDSYGKLLPPEKRLTSFGIFLRKTSLDEIPSLVNVLFGEMSFVGPRPLLLEYVPLYSKEQSLRLSVKPGITGLAQVNGRNSISWEDRFLLDVKYIKNISFNMDLKILIKTVFKVFLRKGITPNNNLIMKPFTGKEISKN